MTIERVIEENVDMLTCGSIVYNNRVLGFSCGGFRGKYELSFDEHTAMGIDLTRVPVRFQSKIGALIFKFDDEVRCKSVLKGNSGELSELTCYPE